MTFTQKLDYLMGRRGLTRGGLARETGIPYTTIVGFYEKGYENIRLSNAKRLAEFFGVPIEYLFDDGADFPPDTEAEGAFTGRYSALSDRSRRIVDASKLSSAAAGAGMRKSMKRRITHTADRIFRFIISAPYESESPLFGLSCRLVKNSSFLI